MFEDTLGKNIEDLNSCLDRDRTDNSGTSNEHQLTYVEKERSRTRQNASTEVSKGGGGDGGDDGGGGGPFTERMSSVGQCRATEPHDYGHPDTQTAYGERCGADTPSAMEEEPLDCTSIDASQPTRSAKHEPLDYTVDMDADAGYSGSYTAEKILYNPGENAQRRQGSDPSLLSRSLSVGIS